MAKTASTENVKVAVRVRPFISFLLFLNMCRAGRIQWYVEGTGTFSDLFFYFALTVMHRVFSYQRVP